MKDYLISLFIDDELDLDEKIDFVQAAHQDRVFKEEAIGLLNQEKSLRADMVARMPPVPVVVRPRLKTVLTARWWGPLAGFAAAMLLVVAVWGLRPASEAGAEKPYRFVLFSPAARQIQLVGSFTQWAPIPMERTGTSGYWALTVELPAGEHRYSFLVEDGRQMADPTVPLRERDDFGGENSIIRIGEAV